MKRIGLVASKIAQGDLVRYNICVVVIATLCAVLLFVVSGISLVVSLFLISFVLRWLSPGHSIDAWLGIGKFSLVVLSAMVGLLNILAIIKNIRLARSKS